MDNFTRIAIDNEFGPFIDLPGRREFDFTLLFEETVLSILPSVLFLLIAPFRVYQLWQTSRKVATSQVRNVKIAMLAIYTSLQVADLVVWVSEPSAQTRASLAAASLSLAAALAICVLSYLEHTRSVRPSSLLSFYLLLTVFMDAAKVRTLWLRGDALTLAVIASCDLAVKIAVLMIEAQEKRRILLSPYSEFPPEVTSGIYSRSLFWWLNPMFVLGYRNLLREMDLFPTDDELKSASLQAQFQDRWMKRRSIARRHELIFSIARSVPKSLVACVFPRLCQTFFRYMQPLLIKRVTSFLSQPNSRRSTNQGWGLTAAYGLVYVGIAVSAARYNHKAFRLATMIRGILVTAVYTKTVDLSITALDENAAITLMSTDVQRICDALPWLHELWACPIEIGLAIWLLYVEIGFAMIGPLSISAVAVLATFVVSSYTGAAQKQWVASIQTRVDITAKALQTMKGVKMLGLTPLLTDAIQRLRLAEVDSSLRSRWLQVIGLVCGNITDVFATGFAFIIFVVVARYNGQALNVSSAFTALSLITLLASPIGILSFTIPPLMATVGCFDRIQEYLLSVSRYDHRLVIPTANEGRQPVLRRSDTEPPTSEANGIELQELTPVRPLPSGSSSDKPVVNVVNLTLAWNDSTEPVINDVSFEVGPGLMMVVGPVGSGKSSLLKGLLGELPSSKGYIYTDCLQVAFVGQDPWIQHGTLRENIVGVANFEHRFYSQVIHACALEQDFASLPHGDHTHVGSSGTGLSGGQKLRVALARAVYSKHHILMLDDVFSGLDAKSEDRIFSRLLGKKGLLRDLRTTVLLVTHAVHRLSYADQIIALDSQGRISEQGTFTELIGSRGYVASLAARHTSEMEEDRPKETADLTKPARSSDTAQANAAEDLTRSAGDLAIYKYYFKSWGYSRTALAFCLLALYGVFLYLPNLWIKLWTSAVSVSGNSVNAKYLGILLCLEAVAFIILFWVSVCIFYLMVPDSARQLHQRLLDTMKAAPLSFFTSTDIGQIINRFSQDLSVIDAELPGSLVEFTASISIGTVQAVLICVSAQYFATIMPLILGLMYVIQKFYLRTSRQIRLMELEAKAPLYSHFIESLNGLTTIRAFGWASDFEQRNLVLLDRSQRPYYMLLCIQRWLGLVLDLTVAGLAVLLMSLIVVLRTKIDAGLVGLALLSIMGFNLSLTQIIKHWTSMETSLGAVFRIKNFVQTTSSEHLPQETASIPKNWPSKGSLTFSHLSAAYTHTGSLVLKDINLTVPSGQKLGLVGRSGSGKSSFVTCLFHMLEIISGSITIDELNISTLPRNELRQHLNVIPQDPFFLSGTIRTNLDPFSMAPSDDVLLTILDTVGLSTIVTQAGGLDAVMDPENLLSHGQRQLFCLARAIVNKRQSRILALDEATASVDLQTDETMQRIIRQEFSDCTIIAVAHRLGTIRDFDRIVVLDQGRVVEDGSPGLLLEDEESWFRKLWDS